MKSFFTSILFLERRNLPPPENMATIKISRDFQCLFARTCSLSTNHTPGKKSANSRRYLQRGVWNKPRPYGKNHIGKRFHKCLIVAKKFPDNPFEPVPLDRLPYSVDTDSQPVACGAVRQIDKTKVVTTHPFPLLVNQPVLPGLDQQPGLGKGLGFHAARGNSRPSQTRQSTASGPWPDDG